VAASCPALPDKPIEILSTWFVNLVRPLPTIGRRRRGRQRVMVADVAKSAFRDLHCGEEGLSARPRLIGALEPLPKPYGVPECGHRGVLRIVSDCPLVKEKGGGRDTWRAEHAHGGRERKPKP
jgi:hypothetical protein